VPFTPDLAKPISSWHLARDKKSNVAYLHSISDGEIITILEASLLTGRKRTDSITILKSADGDGQ
jgi:hypothetical protein